jgi:uncharacterized membrane protein YgdD (TMEM256/DUF423 family)
MQGRHVALLIALLAVYAKVYKSTRAVFTVGLMFFAGMLFLLMLHYIGCQICQSVRPQNSDAVDKLCR